MRSLVFAVLLGLGSTCLAHPGGGHDHHHAQPAAISDSGARVKASSLVRKKVRQGRLPKKWLKIDPSKSYKKSFGHGEEWVVEFQDPKPADPKKKTLYVFVGLTGKVLGINFTGQ